MKRRSFDFVLSAAGLVLAVMLSILALIFRANADFAKDNVREQLSAQKIDFPPAEALSAEERNQPGVVRYAGRQVTDGDMAEVYANEFIGLHLKSIPNVNGRTYAELGGPQRELREKVTKAQQTNDPALPALQKQLDEITTARETVFKGETLRGLLLTTYAFWTLGEKADQAAAVFLGGAILMLVLAVLGFWHYGRTPERERVFEEPAAEKTRPAKARPGRSAKRPRRA